MSKGSYIRLMKMNKLLFSFCLLIFCSFAFSPVSAKNNESFMDKITPKTVAGGALSLLIWPGIGQAINDNKGKKVLTHAIIGILPPFRFWSCYDALVARKDGYWKGRI